MISKNIDTIDDKGRSVAIKLGLPEHAVCEFPANWQTHQGDDADWCEHGRRFPHRDYPDFLSPAGADLLLRTLLARGWKISQWESPAGVHFSIETPRKDTRTLDEALTLPPEYRGLFEFAVDPDWKVAQLKAADNLLKALEEK